MSVVIESIVFQENAPSAAVFPPLQADAQVTLTASDVAWIAASAGLHPEQDPGSLMRIFIRDTPLQLNLKAGDQVFIAPWQNNGELTVSYIIT